RMALQRDLAIRFFDLFDAGAPPDAQHLIVVALRRHFFSAARIQKPSPSVEEGFCSRYPSRRPREKPPQPVGSPVDAGYSFTSSNSASTTPSRPPGLADVEPLPSSPAAAPAPPGWPALRDALAYMASANLCCALVRRSNAALMRAASPLSSTALASF